MHSAVTECQAMVVSRMIVGASIYAHPCGNALSAMMQSGSGEPQVLTLFCQAVLDSCGHAMQEVITIIHVTLMPAFWPCQCTV